MRGQVLVDYSTSNEIWLDGSMLVWIDPMRLDI
jgi:hypothetical protein